MTAATHPAGSAPAPESVPAPEDEAPTPDAAPALVLLPLAGVSCTVDGHCD